MRMQSRVEEDPNTASTVTTLILESIPHHLDVSQVSSKSGKDHQQTSCTRGPGDTTRGTQKELLQEHISMLKALHETLDQRLYCCAERPGGSCCRMAAPSAQ